jgi:hypothetical protein
LALQHTPPLHTPERQELLVKHAMPALPGTMLGAAGAPGRGVAAALALAESEGVGEPLPTELGVALPVRVPRWLEVAVAEDVPLRLPEGVVLRLAMAVALVVAVGEPVWLALVVSEALCVALGDCESEEVAESVPCRSVAVEAGLSLARAVTLSEGVADTLWVEQPEDVMVPSRRGVEVEQGD